MEASSKLKALKFMKRGAPPAGPSQEEQRLAAQREKLAGDSRWRLDSPCEQSGPTSRFAITHDYSPSTPFQASTDSRRAYNMPSAKDSALEEDVDMEASKEKDKAALAKAAERKHKDSVAQRSKKRHFGNAGSIKK